MTALTTGTVVVCHPGAELYGSDRVVLETATALVDAGRRVVVALPGDGPLVGELRSRGAEVEFCRMPVVRKSVLRPAGALRFLRDAAAGWRQGRRLLRRTGAAALVVNTVTIPLWLLIGRASRVPTVCHVHEGEASAGRLLRAGLAAPLLIADRVIANSRFSVGVLARSFRRLADAEVVLNAVPGPATVVPARADIADGLRVVYVGRLSPRKGVDVAVRAVQRLRARGIAARIALVGAVFEGYEWYEAELRALAAEPDLAGAVDFLGFVDPVWDALAAGDVLVVPSRADEPFGNTAVEGILAARPVVASASSGLLEATAGYDAALTVVPDDADALADALERIARDWPAMRDAARHDAGLAEARHSPAAYHRAIVQVVDSTEAAHVR